MHATRRTWTAAIAAAAVVLTVAAAGASAATTLTFRNDLGPIQTEYRGVTSVYMGFGEMAEATAKGMNGTLSTIEYDRAAEADIKIARSWYAADWALPSWPSTAGGYQWSSTKMTAFKSWLSAMRSRSIDVVLNTGWIFPQDICGEGTPPTPACTPGPADETRWVAWVSDSLHQLVNVDGYTNIKYIMPFTEPNGNYGGTIPAGYTRVGYYTHIIDLLDDRIRDDDALRAPDVRPQIKIVGPQESTQINPGFHTYSNVFSEYVNANANADTVDIFSTHRYCNGTPPNAECPTYAQWLTNYSSYVGEMAPKPLWADELGVGTGVSVGDNHPYRRTGPYGTYLAGAVTAQANAGIKTSMLWQFQDQWFQAPYATLYQHWGVARWPGESVDVHPAWYAWALMGNLLGGRDNGIGGSTWVYQTDGGTTDVHGLSVGLSAGVSPCALGGGCATMMVVNEASTPQTVQYDLATAAGAPGQTWYRYVFNANNPPRPAPDKAAYLPRWDKQFTGVTTGIPSDQIPANSVVMYSLMDLGGPVAPNLAPAATAAASSTQAGYAAANTIDRDTSQAASGSSSWAPNSSSVGAQTLDLTWGSAQTFDRVEIDLTASNKLTQYTLQYWNGAAWTNFSPAVSVASNDQAHRTHTFAAVSSTRLRLTVPTPTSPPVNEIQVFDDAGTPNTAIGFTATTNDVASSTNKYAYEKVATTARTFQTGDTIEYDVNLLDNLDNATNPLLDVPAGRRGIGGIDVTIGAATCGGSNALRNAPSGWADQNGVSGSPGSSIATQAYATWFHRVLTVPPCAVGQTSTEWMLVSEQDGRECLAGACSQYVGVKATAFYDNIVVKDNTGATVATVYANGGLETVQSSLSSNYVQADVFVTPRTP